MFRAAGDNELIKAYPPSASRPQPLCSARPVRSPTVPRTRPGSVQSSQKRTENTKIGVSTLRHRPAPIPARGAGAAYHKPSSSASQSVPGCYRTPAHAVFNRSPVRTPGIDTPAIARLPLLTLPPRPRCALRGTATHTKVYRECARTRPPLSRLLRSDLGPSSHCARGAAAHSVSLTEQSVHHVGQRKIPHRRGADRRPVHGMRLLRCARMYDLYLGCID